MSFYRNAEIFKSEPGKWKILETVKAAMFLIKVCPLCFKTEHISIENTTNERGRISFDVCVDYSEQSAVMLI